MSTAVQGQAGEIVSHNPATGEEVGRVHINSADEVNSVVDRSRQAFASWRQTSFAERGRLVMAARQVILSDIDGIAHLISRESGKPFGEAISMEIAPVLDLMQHFARGAKKLLAP
ncbi:MAG: aldehyde dehydrogenase family protein, partial [Blastocatellia bacterium]|nr:aldehyde dehydrogenase family protein [Blastocatellia bacterium]